MGPKTWTHPRVVAALLLAEFVCLAVLLGLFGHAYPDTYRTRLYRVGVDRGFVSGTAALRSGGGGGEDGSSGDEGDKPLIWRPIATEACLFLTIASFALLLAQAALWLHSRHLRPLLAAVPRGMCILAWITVTVIFQIGTATSPSSSSSGSSSSSAAAWYVHHGCGPATSGGGMAQEGCQQALGALGISLVLVALYVAVMAYAVVAVVAYDNRAHSHYGYHGDGGEAEKQGQAGGAGGVGLPGRHRQQQQGHGGRSAEDMDNKEVDLYSNRESMWG